MSSLDSLELSSQRLNCVSCATGICDVQVRDAGNLLQRAGLSLPTVDVDEFTVRYPSGMCWSCLFLSLEDGLQNVMRLGNTLAVAPVFHVYLVDESSSYLSTADVVVTQCGFAFLKEHFGEWGLRSQVFFSHYCSRAALDLIQHLRTMGEVNAVRQRNLVCGLARPSFLFLLLDLAGCHSILTTNGILETLMERVH